MLHLIDYLYLMNTVVPLMMLLVSPDTILVDMTKKFLYHISITNAMVLLTFLLALHDTDSGVNGITWQKSHVTPCFDHRGLWSVVVLLAMPLASCDADVLPACQMTEKSKVQPCFDHLYLTNGMVLLTMQSVSCGVKTSMTWPEGYHPIFFNHLAVRNKKEPLTMPSVSYDAGTGANSNTWPKRHVTPCFSCLYLTDKLVPYVMLLAAHGTDTSRSDKTWLKKWNCTSFDHCNIINAMAPLTTTPLESQRHILTLSSRSNPANYHFIVFFRFFNFSFWRTYLFFFCSWMICLLQKGSWNVCLHVQLSNVPVVQETPLWLY